MASSQSRSVNFYSTIRPPTESVTRVPIHSITVTDPIRSLSWQVRPKSRMNQSERNKTQHNTIQHNQSTLLQQRCYYVNQLLLILLLLL